MCFFDDKTRKETTLGFIARNGDEGFVVLCSSVPPTTNEEA